MVRAMGGVETIASHTSHLSNAAFLASISCYLLPLCFFPTGFFPANILALLLRPMSIHSENSTTWKPGVKITRTISPRAGRQRHFLWSNIPPCLSGHLTAWPNFKPLQTLARAASQQQHKTQTHYSTVRQEQGIRALVFATADSRSQEQNVQDLRAAQHNPTRSSAPPRPGTVDNRTTTISLFSRDGPHERG